MENTPKTPTFEEALAGHQALEAQMENELGCEEIFDPECLPDDELDMIRRIAKAKQAGVDVEDDPITRGFVNGYIMRTVGEPMDEPGYDETFRGADDYYAFIMNGLDLPDSEKAKLIEMVSEENYAEAVENAKEMDPTIEIPTDLREKFILELMTYSPEDLKEICDECEKPRIAIVTANSFEDKIANMDKNKHYEEQTDASVVKGADEPYSNVKNIKAPKAGIIDSMPHPKQQEGAPIESKDRRDYEIARFAKTNKVSLAGPHRMATGYQLTLREAERTGDNSVILDNWGKGVGTATILNPENLTDSRFVACADFGSRYRQVYFFSSTPYDGDGALRGRAWVQVLEF